MEEDKSKKISLSTFFLILSIIAIIVMGIFMYKLNNDKTAEIKKSTELQSQVNSLSTALNDLQGKINSISQTINSNNSTENILPSNEEKNINTNNNLSNSNTTNKNNANINAKKYEGKWSKDNAEIVIKSINDNTISFTYTVVSAKPAERIATIEIKKVQLDKDGFGKFNFEGDGFGLDGNGNGTISLSDDSVIINILKVNMGEDNPTGWTIGEGKTTFNSKD